MPLRGVSAIDLEGGPFYDPAADEALFQALRDNLPAAVELHEMEHNVNDPEFAIAMADRLVEYLGAGSARPARRRERGCVRPSAAAES